MSGNEPSNKYPASKLQLWRRRRLGRSFSVSPSGGGQLCGLADWAVSQSRQDRAQIVADGDVEPAACFTAVLIR